MELSVTKLIWTMKCEVIFLILSINYINATSVNNTKITLEDVDIDLHSSSSEGSAERIKRQLFRNQIPHHRPLTGNIYAYHHGFPHPSRWHDNHQQILPSMGTRNLNVILTDEDFNRYGSTLQHLDDHRIATQPKPTVYEHPVEYGTIVTLDNYGTPHQGGAQYVSQEEGHGHSVEGGQEYGHGHKQVEHGHSVVHDPFPIKSKPYFNFGLKIPFIFNHNKPIFNVQPLLKSLFPRYGHGGSSYGSRRVSESVKKEHRSASASSYGPAAYSWSVVA